MMGFDGIPRPSQLNPLSPYLGANAARVDQARQPLVKSLSKDQQVKGLQKEDRHEEEPEEQEEGETFNEEEAEQIRILAKMRGVMNFSLQSGVRHEFHLNPATGLIDLINTESGQVVLQLMPEELMKLSQKIQKYAGMLTDRSG